ncbi:MAG: HAD-IIIC family phosphatase [Oscillospiraceae bacterium]
MEAHVNGIQNKIKVVIWDLDDTLWEGTLAEGDQVSLYKNRAAIIKTLNRRGIVNAICSKNNFDDAKAKLEEFGLYEEFVFPTISFEAKGPLVKQLLLAMGLRDTNALFIDDNFSNLQEVAYYNPNISTLHADQSDTLLEHPFLKGKDDAQLERLHQYRIMQRKYETASSFQQRGILGLEHPSGILPCAPSAADSRTVERTNQLLHQKPHGAAGAGTAACKRYGGIRLHPRFRPVRRPRHRWLLRSGKRQAASLFVFLPDYESGRRAMGVCASGVSHAGNCGRRDCKGISRPA